MAMTYVEAIGLGFPGVEVHAAGAGSVYEDIVWDAGLPLPSKETLDAWIASNPTADTDWKITVLSLRNRFTNTEKVTIEMASIDNPAAQMQMRQLAAQLRVYMTDLAVVDYVDLSRADTQAGVNLLETYGLIGVGRANEILTTPPTYAELAINAQLT